jgi:hypothetical protein
MQPEPLNRSNHEHRKEDNASTEVRQRELSETKKTTIRLNASTMMRENTGEVKYQSKHKIGPKKI